MLLGRARRGAIVIDDLVAFEERKEEWDALVGRCPNPTQQHDWLAACAHSFHGGRGLHILMVRRSGQLVAAAPLAPSPTGELEPLGMPQMYEASDLPHVDAGAMDVLARALAKSSTTLVLRRLPAASPAIAALTRAYALRGVVHRRETAGMPLIVLGEGWTGPEGALSPRWRSAMRRARRRATALGELTVDLLAPTRDEADAVLAEALAVEANSWRAERGTTLLADAERGVFMREYARRSAAERRLRVAFLRVDGVAVAMQIAVELDRRLWLLKIAHDTRCSSCSPGSLLLLESVRDAAARGLRSFELMGENEPWTRYWTTQSHALVALRARPLGLSLLRDAGSMVRAVGARRTGEAEAATA